MKVYYKENVYRVSKGTKSFKELMQAGKDVAYDEIMDAVSDFDMVNAKLAAILSKLTVEETDC